MIGVSATQYGAAALIIGVSALALIPRDIRQMRAVPPTRGPPAPPPLATVMAAWFRAMSRPWTTGPCLPQPAARNRCPPAPAALPAATR